MFYSNGEFEQWQVLTSECAQQKVPLQRFDSEICVLNYCKISAIQLQFILCKNLFVATKYEVFSNDAAYNKYLWIIYLCILMCS